MPTSPPTAPTVVMSPNPTAPEPQLLAGVEHEHRPGGTERDVEDEDGQHQGAHGRVVPDPADALGDVVAEVGRALLGLVRRAGAPGRSARPRRRPGSPGRRTATRGRRRTGTPPAAGPTSWLTVTNPAMIRLFASARSSRRTSIGTRVPEALSANVSAVPRTNMAVSTSTIEATSVSTAAASSSRTSAAERVDDDHQPPPVQPVRHRTGPEPEQQRRQPLEQRGQRDDERVVGHARPRAADRRR